MKRFAALALVLIGLGMPAAFGQRGGGHGGGFGGGHGGGFGGGHGGGFGGGHGFSGGSAGTFHGGGFAAPHFSSGFSAPRFSRGYAAPRNSGYWGNARYQTRYYGSYPTNSRSGYGYSSGYGHSGSGHHNGGGGFHWSIRTVPTYATLVPGWLGLGPYGYYPYGYGLVGWDDDSSWSSDDPPSAAPQGYDPGYGQAPEQQEEVYRPEYQPSAAVPAPIADPENQSVTTIVLNDGRSVQIHNYALTPTTLYVLDSQRRNIPLEDINIAATQKANRAVGIDFQVPKIAQ